MVTDPISSRVSIEVLVVSFGSYSSRLSKGGVYARATINLALFTTESPTTLVATCFAYTNTFPLARTPLRAGSLSSSADSRLLSSRTIFPIRFLFAF